VSPSPPLSVGGAMLDVSTEQAAINQMQAKKWRDLTFEG
jgi:hypothetical protein